MDVAALLSPVLRDQLESVARRAGSHLVAQREALESDSTLADRLVLFEHAIEAEPHTLAAVSAHGVYPVLRAAGASAVFTGAAAAAFRPGADGRPHEVPTEVAPLLDVAWIADDDPAASLDAALERLAGRPLLDVIEASDYRHFKAGRSTPAALMAGLLRPGAEASKDIAIQLQQTAELGLALAHIEGATSGDWVLVGHTMALPYVRRTDLSLFQEHLLRLCATTARDRGVGFATVTDATDLPVTDAAARLAARQRGTQDQPADHWALRLPDRASDSLGAVGPIAPASAVAYVGRFHARGAAFRLDLDREAWTRAVRPDGPDADVRERALFERLDYFAHDLRAYGTPYPLFAARTRAHVTEAERASLRGRLREAVVRYGPANTALPTPR